MDILQGIYYLVGCVYSCMKVFDFIANYKPPDIPNDKTKAATIGSSDGDDSQESNTAVTR